MIPTDILATENSPTLMAHAISELTFLKTLKSADMFVYNFTFWADTFKILAAEIQQSTEQDVNITSQSMSFSAATVFQRPFL